MSLTNAEQRATRQELQANFELTGLSLERVATDLQTTPEHVADVLELNVRHIEEPWILRNYFNEQLSQQGRTPKPYSRLTGSPVGYWFLNQRRISQGRLG